MSYSIISYTVVFLLLGSGGMYAANRSVDAKTKQQRWIKFATYIVIIGSAIATIFLNQFHLLATLIVAAGLYELLSHIAKLPSTVSKRIAIGIYSILSTSFLTFSTTTGQSFILFVCFQVFIFDGFSQVVGQLLGKRKILPVISPGKTLEGLVGGTLFCLTAATAIRYWVNLPVEVALTTGLTIAAFSFAGDVLASYFKRKVKIKDYSQLIPEHGGILDRFDSLIGAGAGYMAVSVIQLYLFQLLQ